MAKLSNKKLLVIAVVLSLMTAMLVYQYLKGITTNVQNAKSEVSVIVAKVDIGPKTRITAEMVSEVKMPPEYIEPGAIESMDKVVGIVAREQIVSGEQINERRLVLQGKSVGFTGVIPRDKRALTMAVNEVTGVAGFVKAGDYVDVVVTFDTSAVGDNVSHVLMQNILVLAANRNVEKDMPDANSQEATKESKDAIKATTVTLAVSPDEAAKLTLAEEKGKIHLTLRPYMPSNGVVITEAITPKDLVGSYTAPVKNEQTPPAYVEKQEVPPIPPIPKSPPIPENRGIQVIRGSKTESIPLN